MSEIDQNDDQGQIKLVANLLYSFITCVGKPNPARVWEFLEDTNEVLTAYNYELMDLTQFADADDLTKLIRAFCNANCSDFEHIMLRFELKALDEKENLDSYHLTQMIKSFTNNNYMVGYGTDKLYDELETQVIKKWSEFDMKSLSHIIYSYAFREQGTPHFHEKALETIKA